MRLPWPFGRQQPDATPPAADVFSARPRGAEAWRDLPVLERSVGEPPLMAPVRAVPKQQVVARRRRPSRWRR